jgi:hypothetical protein
MRDAMAQKRRMASPKNLALILSLGAGVIVLVILAHTWRAAIARWVDAVFDILPL